MAIPQLDMVLLFVTDSLKSVCFYSKILGKKPVEQSPTFALFLLPNGVSLGLWSTKTAEPVTHIKGGGAEIGFKEDNVDKVHDEWVQLGIPIAQKPTDMDFGRTCVALDPDGHRIRVYRLHEEG